MVPGFWYGFRRISREKDKISSFWDVGFFRREVVRTTGQIYRSVHSVSNDIGQINLMQCLSEGGIPLSPGRTLNFTPFAREEGLPEDEQKYLVYVKRN